MPLAARRVDRYRRSSGAVPLGGEDHRTDIEAWLQGLRLERYVPEARGGQLVERVAQLLSGAAGDRGHQLVRELATNGGSHLRHFLDRPEPKPLPPTGSLNAGAGVGISYTLG
jgi:hypothetical protein